MKSPSNKFLKDGEPNQNAVKLTSQSTFMKIKEIQITVNAGTAHGRGPGHHYQGVRVSITRKNKGRWTVDILETLGIDSGFDEEQCRKQVIGRDATLDAAVERAERLAMAAGIEKPFLAQSLSQAVSQANEAIHATKDN